jgi:hypothetical protein
VAEQSIPQKVRGFVRRWRATRNAEGEFQRNLVDWRRGGPHGNGYTRAGPPISTPDCALDGLRRQVLSAEECFAKNFAEIKRWHLAFLYTVRDGGGNLLKTAYFHEYLLARYSRDAAEQRVARFAALYNNMAITGRRSGSYVWVADLASVAGLPDCFGFRYFRFNGAHRLSCLYALGVRQAPCLVFSLRSAG